MSPILQMSTRFALVASLFLCVGARADSGVDSAVAPDSGDVFGYVLDANSHLPIAKSQVRIVAPPGMETPKRAAGTTNEDGLLQLQSNIGNVRSSFAIERLGDLSIASVLSGGAKKVEKFVAVSQLVVEVSAPGYQTFYGPTPVISAKADATHFSAQLQPIYLAPDKATFRSYSNVYPPEWKNYVTTLTPLLANYGDNMTLVLTSPQSAVGADPGDAPFVYYRLDSGFDILNVLEVMPARKNTRPTDGIFESTFKISKKTTPGIEKVSVGGYVVNRDIYFAVGVPEALKTDVTAQLTQINKAEKPEQLQILDAIVKIWSEAKVTVDPYRVDLLDDREAALQLLRQLKADKKNKANVPNLTFKEILLLGTLGRIDEAKVLAGKDKSRQSIVAMFSTTRTDLLKALAANPRNYGARAQLLGSNKEDAKLALSAVPQPTTPEEAIEFARFAIARFPSVKTSKSDAQQAVALIANKTPDSKGQRPDQELAVQLLWEAGLKTEAATFAEEILKDPKSLGARQFFPFYVRAMSQWQKDPQKARETLGQALKLARTPATDASKGTSQVFFDSKSYTVYDNPLVSGSVGFSSTYAKAGALLFLYAPSADNPTKDWLATTILARALALCQQPEDGIALLSKIAAQSGDEPQFWLARAWCARAADDNAMVQKSLAQVSRLNSREPELALFN